MNDGLPRRRIRARASVLWGLACFAFLQGVLVCALFYWIPQVRDPVIAYKIERLKARLTPLNHRPFTVVFLGSSRVEWGVRGKILEANLSQDLGRPVISFNLSAAGGGPICSLLALGQLLDEGIRPDMVVVEVMPLFLTGQHPPDELSAEQLPALRLRRRDLSIIKRYGNDIRPDLKREWLMALLTPSHSYRSHLLTRISPSWVRLRDRPDLYNAIDETGWVNSLQGRDVEELRARLHVNLPARLNRLFAGFCLGDRPIAALREVLALCRAEGIPNVLLTMPEGEILRGVYSPGAWEAVEALLRNLSGEFNIAYVNAREWMTESDLFDSHHLMPAGAAAFTERLGREALAPLIRARINARQGLAAGVRQGSEVPE